MKVIDTLGFDGLSKMTRSRCYFLLASNRLLLENHLSLVIERSHFYAAVLHKSVLLIAGTLFYVSLSLLWLPSGLNLQSLKFLSLLLWPALAVLFVFLKLNKFEHHQLVVANTE